jgi:methionyl-tRNA formyltransferase
MTDYVIYRGRFRRDYQFAAITKKTAQLYKLGSSTGYDAQIYHKEAEIILPETEAKALYAKVRALQDYRNAIIKDAQEDCDRRTAQAIEAQRAETAKTGSVEDESAVTKECAQKGGPNAPILQ